MRAFDRREIFRSEGYEIRVVGGPPPRFRDVYHWLIRVPWWATLAVIAGGYLALNTAFAGLYLVTGGVSNVAPGSFLDAFFFSVQTMGTIGYGGMMPVSRAANVLVVAESVTGLVVIALATGLVFARFSQVRARVAFSSRLAVGPLDGTPTLQIRLGNERRGRIVNVALRLSLVRSTRTQEGVAIYRTLDLPLAREHVASLARSWMAIHRITEASPLFRDTPESLAAAEAELTLEVAGVDETSGQAIHAQRTWRDGALAWGARLADVISETEDGNLQLDLGRFHDVVPTEPVEGFPYGAVRTPTADRAR